MTEEKQEKEAFLLTLCAYIIWGFLPLYLKQLHDVSPWAITANRILWTIPWALGLALIFHGKKSLKITYQTFFMLIISALFIGCNWTLYAWAVSQNRIMETALGYFINPLMNIVLGIVFFHEKLGKIKLLALVLASLGVINQAAATGHFPLFGICLAALFAGYGLVRKKVIVPPAAGLFWESLALSPVAIIGLQYLNNTGFAAFGGTASEKFWLLLSGPVTAIPLILFAVGARNLKFSTLGMLQYIAPSIVFVISLFYGEKFTISHAITFGLIWTALGIYTYSEIKGRAK